jgi:hypothetical protein
MRIETGTMNFERRYMRVAMDSWNSNSGYLCRRHAQLEKKRGQTLKQTKKDKKGRTRDVGLAQT